MSTVPKEITPEQVMDMLESLDKLEASVRKLRKKYTDELLNQLFYAKLFHYLQERDLPGDHKIPQRKQAESDTTAEIINLHPPVFTKQ